LALTPDGALDFFALAEARAFVAGFAEETLARDLALAADFFTAFLGFEAFLALPAFFFADAFPLRFAIDSSYALRHSQY
jgi:hypothetical protein